MATKTQIINFILETFEEDNGNPVSRTKLENYKKADLENFIKVRGLESKLEAWIVAQ